MLTSPAVDSILILGVLAAIGMIGVSISRLLVALRVRMIHGNTSQEATYGLETSTGSTISEPVIEDHSSPSGKHPEIPTETAPSHYVSIYIRKDRINKASIDNYFDTRTNFIRMASRSIYSLHYLPNKHVLKFLSEDEEEVARASAEYLEKKYRAYYKEVEARIAAGVYHTCVLQLPTGVRDEAVSQGYQHMLEVAVDLLYKQTVSHYTNSWLIDDTLFNLYVIPEAFVSYSYSIIDDKNILSEYFRYDEEGVTYPDELYVNLSGVVDNQVQRRRKWLDLAISERDPVSKDQFVRAINSLVEDRDETDQSEQDDAQAKKEIADQLVMS